MQCERVTTKEQMKEFVELPFRLYRDYPYWVAPLKKENLKYMMGKNTELLHCPHSHFLVGEGRLVRGRILAFVDEELNEYHGTKVGYLAAYEAEDDPEVSSLLFSEAEAFLRGLGMEEVKGPVSLPGGEDHRGLVVEGFEEIPAIMNTTNFPYYNDQFLAAGYEKYHDCYAFTANREDLQTRVDELERILPRVQKRYSYHVDTVDLKHHEERDLEDIYRVLEEGLPKSWLDFKPVSKEEIQNIFAQVKPFVDPDLVCIARTDEGRPIGFDLALPDYNEILKDFHGKMGPRQVLSFLKKKRHFDRLRMFVLFVIPEFQKKGVSASIYYTCFKNAVAKGYQRLEGSTIWDYNQPMLTDIEKFGAKKNITYRIYRKAL